MDCDLSSVTISCLSIHSLKIDFIIQSLLKSIEFMFFVFIIFFINPKILYKNF